MAHTNTHDLDLDLLMSPETFYGRSVMKSSSESAHSDKLQLRWNIPSIHAISYGVIGMVSSGFVMHSMSTFSKFRPPFYAKILLPVAVAASSTAYKIQLDKNVE